MNKHIFGSWFHLFQENSFITTETYFINTQKPIDYDKELPELKIDTLQSCDLEDIKDFFIKIKNEEIKICILNGKDITNWTHKWCDYCNCLLDNKTPPLHICKLCKKIMCNLCYEEKTEEIAIKNGSKNWKKRKNYLLNCFSHIENIYTEKLRINCDICNCSSIDTFGYWHTNRKQNKDVCPTCFYVKNGQDFMEKISGKWGTVFYTDDFTNLDFGSILDWIPVMKTTSEDFVLYNINKNSKMYKKLSLCYSDENKNLFIYV